jgi:prepilin-type N-terminal cleavage/methylation domain-containing protein
MGCERNSRGFTLVELLISVLILGIIAAGLQQTLAAAIRSYADTANKPALLGQARFAMERMVLFAQETDTIVNPVGAAGEEVLKVGERILDMHDNTTHAYAVGGDGYLDTDTDRDQIVNEHAVDLGEPVQFVTFDLDKTDAGNWKLMEQIPDYGTAALTDYAARRVICERVTAFNCRRLSANLIEIHLTLGKDRETATLTTCIKARFVE